MSLPNHLLGYVPFQLSPTPFGLSGVDKFIEDVWGQPQALLRSQDGIEFLELGEYINILGPLSAWALKKDRILVRQEYQVAFDAIYRDDFYEEGAFVIGQPGIGKTYFLFYALVRLLGLKKAVAMQPLDGSPIYILFKESGAEVNHISNHQSLYDVGCEVWALCDTNSKIPDPPGVFRSVCNVRTLLAASPSAIYWKGFSKETGAAPFIMDVWSKEEVESLAKLLQLDVNHLVNLAAKWGGTPGTWMRCQTPRNELLVEQSFYHGVYNAVENCAQMLNGERSLDFPPGAPSQFYFIRPKVDATTGILCRFACDVCIPTATIGGYLSDGLTQQTNQMLSDFYTALNGHSMTRAAAAFIYEGLFHNFVSGYKEFWCRWFLDGTEMTSIILQFPRLPKAIPSTLGTPRTRKPPYYWRPFNSNFPGIDSALVLEDRIYAFRLTINEHHGTLVDGLRELRTCLGEEEKRLPLRVVFVGVTEEQVMQVIEPLPRITLSGARVPVGSIAMVPTTDHVLEFRWSEDEPAEICD